MCCVILQVCYRGDHSGVRLQLLALRPQDGPGAKHQITMTTTPGNSEKSRAKSSRGRDADQKSDGQMDDRQEL